MIRSCEFLGPDILADMGLRVDAARWSAEEARKTREAIAKKAAADAAAAPRWRPDWHKDLVSVLRANRFPQLPVFDYLGRKPYRFPGPGPTGDLPIRHRFKRTGVRVWVIRAIVDDNGPNSSSSKCAIPLGVDENALYGLRLYASEICGASPILKSEADRENQQWYPLVVALVGSLTTSQSAPHVTVLRSPKDF